MPKNCTFLRNSCVHEFDRSFSTKSRGGFFSGLYCSYFLKRISEPISIGVKVPNAPIFLDIISEYAWGSCCHCRCVPRDSYLVFSKLEVRILSNRFSVRSNAGCLHRVASSIIFSDHFNATDKVLTPLVGRDRVIKSMCKHVTCWVCLNTRPNRFRSRQITFRSIDVGTRSCGCV